MSWLLCGLVAAVVLHCTHCFILNDEHNCPTTCSCSETSVSCQSNTLHGWPDVLQNADILERLNLGDNPQLGNIPRGAFDSFKYSLTYLLLFNTGLTQVPPDIKHLQNLKYLQMSDNPIGDRGFPDDAFGNGPMAIDRLSIYNTSLTKIPLALCSLSSLLKLDLNENIIKMISDEEAHCIRNVTTLYITNCGMSRIPSSFRLLTKLTFLDLGGNPLRSIEHYDLTGLNSLGNLLLGNTSISYIAPGAFQWTPSLGSLELQGNDLTEIPDSFRLLPSGAYISLSDNPVHCSCDMKWASDWMNNTRPRIAGTCENHAVPIDTYIKTFLSRCPS